MPARRGGMRRELWLVFGLELGEVSSAPGRAMVDNPIDQSSVKSNVAASLFAFDPFVTEYFRFLGAKGPVKPRFHEALRPIVRINESHGILSRHKH
jgi:hypothetical protein